MQNRGRATSTAAVSQNGVEATGGKEQWRRKTFSETIRFFPNAAYVEHSDKGEPCWGGHSGWRQSFLTATSNGQTMEGLPLKIEEEHDEGFGFWNI
jgi:hypothetical protein